MHGPGKRSYVTLALVAVVAAAAALRFHGLNWDQQIAAHPDERYIVGAASRLSFPYALNPFEREPGFAYGHLPLYLLAFVAALAPEVDALLLGRVLSATLDLAAVAVTFLLGRRVYDARAGLLAAALVGFAVAHVQQAHFYTPDTLLALFTIGTLWFAVRFVQDGRSLDLWLAGTSVGLATSTKATGAFLLIPMGAACFSLPDGEEAAVGRAVLAAGLSFLVVSPFAVVELPTFLRNLAGQAAILHGYADVPYTRQYHGTLPYVYPMVQQLRWGMGWLAGSCALAGLAWEGVQAVRLPPRPGRWIMLAWVLPYLGFVGGLYAKFPRYVLPAIPVLAIFAAHLLTDLARRWRPLLPLLSTALVGPLLLRSSALTAMYECGHPWVAASNWLQEQAEPGTTIAVESWDHPLPLDATGYELVELPIFEDETAEKWEAMRAGLEAADYLVIASRRGYASVARWPERYGRTSQYYAGLFNGTLGFEPVACFGRHPRLGSLVLRDDPTAGLSFSLPELCRTEVGAVLRVGRLDESFVVYDHPQAIIFKAGPGRGTVQLESGRRGDSG